MEEEEEGMSKYPSFGLVFKQVVCQNYLIVWYLAPKEKKSHQPKAKKEKDGRSIFDGEMYLYVEKELEKEVQLSSFFLPWTSEQRGNRIFLAHVIRIFEHHYPFLKFSCTQENSTIEWISEYFSFCCSFGSTRIHRVRCEGRSGYRTSSLGDQWSEGTIQYYLLTNLWMGTMNVL